MQSGNMYLMPVDSPWYALMPTRIWYTPWRWNLQGALIPARLWHTPWRAAVFESEYTPIASNIRHDEIIALMKLMGAYHIGD